MAVGREAGRIELAHFSLCAPVFGAHHIQCIAKFCDKLQRPSDRLHPNRQWAAAISIRSNSFWFAFSFDIRFRIHFSRQHESRADGNLPPAVPHSMVLDGRNWKIWSKPINLVARTPKQYYSRRQCHIILAYALRIFPFTIQIFFFFCQTLFANMRPAQTDIIQHNNPLFRAGCIRDTRREEKKKRAIFRTFARLLTNDFIWFDLHVAHAHCVAPHPALAVSMPAYTNS